MKSSLSIWHYVVSVKSTVKISSIFVAFLENTNFNHLSYFQSSEKNPLAWNLIELPLALQILWVSKSAEMKPCMKRLTTMDC